MKRRFERVMIATVVVLGLAARAHATTITYTATNLADVVVGQDLWQYSYLVTGAPFPVDQGFTVFFNYSLYTQLQTAASVGPGPDWDTIVAPPSVITMTNGLFDALALGASPTLAVPFTVKFVWLGPGTPGAQPFERYQLSPQFSVLESGQTIPLNPTAVPEPATWVLLATGLSMAVTRCRRWRRRSDH
jgi:hypothetical protein